MTKLVSVKQVAEALGISTRSIFRMIKQEQIPQPARIGGQLRFVESEILEWIKASKNGERK